MWFPWILPHILTVLGFALCVLLIARLFRSHHTPGVTMAWLLAILLIPWAGVPAYLLFGGRKVRRMVRRKEALYGQPEEGRQPENVSQQTTERVLVTAGMPPARRGNRIEFLPDGEAGFAGLTSLIEGARQSVHLMTFLMRRDETGRAIVELLARKAAEGVEVKLLLDALGCLFSRGRFVDPIRTAGGQVGIFMPVLPLRRKWSAHLRNHRKIAVVDGRAAMIGGMNLADEYMGPTPNPKRWLDTASVIEGPAAADLDAIFASDWNFASEEMLEPAAVDRPAGAAANGSTAQVAASGPDTPDDTLYEAILTATMEAKRRVWIVTPYFIPDETLLRALMLQARLGRDVRIIVPAHSNHFMADLARGRPLRELAWVGAQVFTHRHMVHAKLMVFDFDLAVVGSANVDLRSLYLNYEAMLFTYSAGEVETVAQWIRLRTEESTRLEPGPVPAVREWAENLGALVTPLL